MNHVRMRILTRSFALCHSAAKCMERRGKVCENDRNMVVNLAARKKGGPKGVNEMF